MARGKRIMGKKHLCGRCQDHVGDYWVENAPTEIYNLWCRSCIWQVEGGRRPIIPGVSIDREGFVIEGDPLVQISFGQWVFIGGLVASFIGLMIFFTAVAGMSVYWASVASVVGAFILSLAAMHVILGPKSPFTYKSGDSD